MTVIDARSDTSCLPHSIELERTILNASLCWNYQLPVALEASDFFRTAHQQTFLAIREAERRELSREFPVIREVLRERGQLDEVGQIYLTDLAILDARPTPSAFEANITQLQELARKRRIVQLMLRCTERPDALDVDRLIADLELLRRVGQAGAASAFRTAKELSEAAERVEWLVRGLLARGAITELTGKAKLSGKTTLIAYLVACLLDGDLCLGTVAAKTPVVWLTEQSHATFREVLRRSALLDRTDVSILSYWDVKGQSWPAIAAMAEKECERIDAQVLVVDTLAQFAGIKGDGENNSGDALEALAPLQGIAHRGRGVLITRHARKSGGEVGDDGRGSSAFTGGVDIVLSLKRPEGNHKPTMRLLEGLSRYDETPSKTVIEKVSAHVPILGIEVWADSFVVLGDTEAVALDEARITLQRVLPAGPDAALSLKAIEQSSGLDRSVLQRAIKAIPEIKSIGKGRKGDPLRYFRPEMVSAQTPISRIGA